MDGHTVQTAVVAGQGTIMMILLLLLLVVVVIFVLVIVVMMLVGITGRERYRGRGSGLLQNLLHHQSRRRCNHGQGCFWQGTYDVMIWIMACFG